MTEELSECAVQIQMQLNGGREEAQYPGFTKFTFWGADSRNLKPAWLGFKSDCLFPAAIHCVLREDNGGYLIPGNSGVTASDPFCFVEAALWVAIVVWPRVAIALTAVPWAAWSWEKWSRIQSSHGIFCPSQCSTDDDNDDENDDYNDVDDSSSSGSPMDNALKFTVISHPLVHLILHHTLWV